MKKVIIAIVSTLVVVGLVGVGVGYYLLRQIPAGAIIVDYIPTDPGKMAREVDKIVIGKVTKILPGKISKNSEGFSTIYTDVVIAVSSTLKGTPEKTTTVRTMGGTVFLWDVNFAMSASNEAHFEVDEEVLVFLSTTDDYSFFEVPQGYYIVPYGEQGKYEISDGKAKLRGEKVISVDELLQQIKNSLRH